MPIKSREEVLEILAAVKPELQKEFKLRRIGLFGSYARMERRSESDADVLVEVDPSIGLQFVPSQRRSKSAWVSGPKLSPLLILSVGRALCKSNLT